ncbi:hypothetical protein ACFL6Y_06095 [Elusimicrobiota bacterium]
MPKPNNKIARKILFIMPHLQSRIMGRFMTLVVFCLILNWIAAIGWVAYLDKKAGGEFFVAAQSAQGSPRVYSKTKLILPPLAASGIAAIVLSLFFSAFYSHRMAGPLYRISKNMQNMARGAKHNKNIQIRQQDEFQEMAESMNVLLEDIYRDNDEIAQSLKDILEDIKKQRLPQGEISKISSTIKNILDKLKK